MEPFGYVTEPGKPGLFYLQSWMERYPELTAGFTSRHGGISQGEYRSLNMGLHVADCPQDVIENRRRVADAVKQPLAGWVYGEQVHGSRIAVITAADRGKGTLERLTAIQEADAFITNEQDICLAALFADCVPLFFYDPVTGSMALAHAGWKGTAAQIARSTVEAMVSEYQVIPENLVAAIGPAIGQCCYEVDEKLINTIDKTLDEVLSVEEATSTKDRRDIYYKMNAAKKFQLNLHQINRQIMIKAGIMPSSIEITERCTGCGTDLFFSHRKENGITGRMAAWIALGSSV
ncbi:MAG: peptidoglycan editing factor PgeF [Gorillibacterium sp.]|nr:peptidoglycan editing factor PgeF [Gorillibacterium sp.]